MSPGKSFERSRRVARQITIRIPLEVWRKLKPLIEEGSKDGFSITDVTVTLLAEALEAREKADSHVAP